MKIIENSKILEGKKEAFKERSEQFQFSEFRMKEQFIASPSAAERLDSLSSETASSSEGQSLDSSSASSSEGQSLDSSFSELKNFFDGAFKIYAEEVAMAKNAPSIEQQEIPAKSPVPEETREKISDKRKNPVISDTESAKKKKRKVTAQRSLGKSSSGIGSGPAAKDKGKATEGPKIQVSNAGVEQMVFPMGMSYWNKQFVKHLGMLINSVEGETCWENRPVNSILTDVFSNMCHTIKGVYQIGLLHQEAAKKAHNYSEEKTRADLTMDKLKKCEDELTRVQEKLVEKDIELEAAKRALVDAEARANEMQKERDDVSKAKKEVEMRERLNVEKLQDAQLAVGLMLREYKTGLKKACQKRYPNQDFTFLDLVIPAHFMEIVQRKLEEKKTKGFPASSRPPRPNTSKPLASATDALSTTNDPPVAP